MAQGALHMVVEHPTVPGAAVPEKKKSFPLSLSWLLGFENEVLPLGKWLPAE